MVSQTRVDGGNQPACTSKHTQHNELVGELGGLANPLFCPREEAST
jgi:hypothetical protein